MYSLISPFWEKFIIKLYLRLNFEIVRYSIINYRSHILKWEPISMYHCLWIQFVFEFSSYIFFSPDGYNLPLEYTKLAAECNKKKIMLYEKACNKFIEDKPIWICKPVSKSQGRGIFLFRVRFSHICEQIGDPIWSLWFEKIRMWKIVEWMSELNLYTS